MRNRVIKTKILAKREESGFTLIEAVIAIVILTIGLIGTAAAVTFALEFTSISRNVTSGKLVIVSTIEEVESLRNTRRLEFKQIANVGAVDNTDVDNPFEGFSTGWKPVSTVPGPDGVFGTDDDLTSPGADGVYGTVDDVTDNSLARKGFSREIVISFLPGSTVLKKVEVNVRYPAAQGKIGQISGVGYLNDEFRITR
ncbi:MAG: prepilin-type N-terminal cleavage/methylation domain-containing protein [Pyrinomonadaceae bacterium]